MASASESVAVNIDCNGQFDVDRVVVYNILNVGRFVVNLFDNTFNFCVSVRLLNEKHKCSCCRRMLKLSVGCYNHTTTPVVLHCSNKSCPKEYYNVRVGTFFDSSKFPFGAGKQFGCRGCPGSRSGAYSSPQTVAGGEGAGCPLPNNPDWARRASILGPLGLGLPPFGPRSTAFFGWHKLNK